MLSWSQVVAGMQSELTAELAAEPGVLPGAILAVERDLGQINLTSINDTAPPDWSPNQICAIASVAKPFVALAVLKVIEQHPETFGDDINAALDSKAHTLTGLKDLGRNSTPADPNPHMYHKRNITLRHLLTHTSSLRWLAPFSPDQVVPEDPPPLPPGTSRWVGSPGLTNELIHDPDNGAWIPARIATLSQVARHVMRQRLIVLPDLDPVPPGRLAQYSSYGYVLAAHLVESYAGVPFARYLTEQFFQPLGMSNTFCTAEEMDAAHRGRIPDMMLLTVPQAPNGTRYLPPDVAPPLHTQDRTRWDKLRKDWKYVWPEGGIYSTARDLLAFLRMLRRQGVADSGTRILSERSVELVYQNQFTVPPLAQKLLPNDESRKGRTIGFAWNGDGAWPGLPADSLQHGGRSMTLLWIDRRGLSGVFLSQRLVSVVTDPGDTVPDEAYNGWDRGLKASRRFTDLASQMLA